MPTPPLPHEVSLKRSRSVEDSIRADISAAGGWISFARFMELALYAPGMGYYSGGEPKFGKQGDFITAPLISSLFGRTIARQTMQILRLMKGDAGNSILEFGGGTGKLALDILCELEKLGSLPKRYYILEVSAELQQRQRRTFEDAAPHLLPLLDWLGHLPVGFKGLLLANEVLDAMPSHLVVWRSGGIFERGVSWSREGLTWLERPLAAGELFNAANEVKPIIDEFAAADAEDYVSEINLAAQGFTRSLGNSLQQGAILLMDYGFGRGEYYHPQRNRGTLMCHYRHRAHDNPFYLPGLQDITSHVDFSAVASAAANADLDFLGYTTQANFLINCGITEILAQTSPDDARVYLPLANQLQRLVSPAEMGDLFKVIAFGKNIDQPLTGFVHGDKRRML